MASNQFFLIENEETDELFRVPSGRGIDLDRILQDNEGFYYKASVFDNSGLLLDEYMSIPLFENWKEYDKLEKHDA